MILPYRIVVQFNTSCSEWQDFVDIMKEAELRYRVRHNEQKPSIAFATIDNKEHNIYDMNISPHNPKLWKEVLESQAGIESVTYIQ